MIAWLTAAFSDAKSFLTSRTCKSASPTSSSITSETPHPDPFTPTKTPAELLAEDAIRRGTRVRPPPSVILGVSAVPANVASEAFLEPVLIRGKVHFLPPIPAWVYETEHEPEAHNETHMEKALSEAELIEQHTEKALSEVELEPVLIDGKVHFLPPLPAWLFETEHESEAQNETHMEKALSEAELIEQHTEKAPSEAELIEQQPHVHDLAALSAASFDEFVTYRQYKADRLSRITEELSETVVLDVEEEVQLPFLAKPVDFDQETKQRLQRVRIDWLSAPCSPAKLPSTRGFASCCQR